MNFKISALMVLTFCFVPLFGLYNNSMRSPSKDTMMKNQNIADIAMSNSDFSTLVTAVKAAGLVDALKGTTELTVFAPTNAAFAKLPKGTVEALLADKEKLANILKYHIVPGKVLAADVLKLKSAKALNGDTLNISVRDGKVYVNNAQVIKTDILGTNGVIHVIDTVLIP